MCAYTQESTREEHEAKDANSLGGSAVLPRHVGAARSNHCVMLCTYVECLRCVSYFRRSKALRKVLSQSRYVVDLLEPSNVLVYTIGVISSTSRPFSIVRFDLWSPRDLGALEYR